MPAAAIGIALVWLGQVPGPVELAGGGIALAGAVLAGSARAAPGWLRTWPRSGNRCPFGKKIFMPNETGCVRRDIRRRGG